MTQQHPYTVMTVCTGNICRSPMAEIILRAEFESRGIGEDRVRVLSSGVSDEEYGHPIDPRAVRVLRADGYEIPTHHFAHRVTREEIEETDPATLEQFGAGVIMGNENNIIFNNVDGQPAITGINLK